MSEFEDTWAALQKPQRTKKRGLTHERNVCAGGGHLIANHQHHDRHRQEGVYSQVSEFLSPLLLSKYRLQFLIPLTGGRCRSEESRHGDDGNN